MRAVTAVLSVATVSVWISPTSALTSVERDAVDHVRDRCWSRCSLVKPDDRDDGVLRRTAFGVVREQARVVLEARQGRRCRRDCATVIALAAPVACRTAPGARRRWH